MARDIVRRRYRPSINAVSRAGGGMYWFDRDKLIGTSELEDSPIHRLKPRRLGNPRNR